MTMQRLLVLVVAANVFAMAINLYAAAVNFRLRHELLASLAVGECRDAPPVVDYHEGMTLCPGQTAVGHVDVRVRKP